MKQKGLVSVIIPSYKNNNLLERAINSVLNQTYKKIELIVVDDNEPDSVYRKETETLMLKYLNRENVKYVKNGKNSERSYSRNNGVKHSNGEYIAFLDNDDEYLPEKIERQVQRFEEMGSDYVVCYSAYKREKGGRIVCKCGEFREGNLEIEILARDFPIHPGSNLLIRRDVFEKCGGFNESMSKNEDIDFLYRAIKYGYIACDREIGLIVHLHEKEQSFDYELITRNYINVEKREIEELDEKKKFLLCQILGLQIMKYYIHYPAKILKIKKEWNISTIRMISYGVYLGIRAIKKSAYGYL